MEHYLYCNRHARNQPSDIIAVLFLRGSGVHSFLCDDAQFSVHKAGVVFVKAGEKILMYKPFGRNLTL